MRTGNGKIRLCRPGFMAAMLLVAVILVTGPLAELANAQATGAGIRLKRFESWNQDTTNWITGNITARIQKGTPRRSR
jgi:hypothetical protein